MSGKGVTKRTISRSDIRKATIHSLKTVRTDPRSIKITPGQRRTITQSSAHP